MNKNSSGSGLNSSGSGLNSSSGGLIWQYNKWVWDHEYGRKCWGLNWKYEMLLKDSRAESTGLSIIFPGRWMMGQYRVSRVVEEDQWLGSQFQKGWERSEECRWYPAVYSRRVILWKFSKWKRQELLGVKVNRHNAIWRASTVNVVMTSCCTAHAIRHRTVGLHPTVLFTILFWSALLRCMMQYRLTASQF